MAQTQQNMETRFGADSALVEGISGIVLEAGEIMRKAHVERAEIVAKEGHKNFVTKYDTAVQSFLEEKLSALHPAAHFFAEEDAEHDTAMLEKGDVFVIDPIDGTSNFMKGFFPSTISVGMFRDGVPYLGVILVPASGDLFRAVRGCGSWRGEERIHTAENSLGDSIAVFGTSVYYGDEIIHKALRTAEFYVKRCIDVRRTGCASYDICMVACGAAGIFAEPVLQIWDFSAAAVILEEAGGKITDFEGKPLTFRGASTIVAASAGVLKEDYLPVV
ncbi:MAG: inositol monophosphatase [Lachnospiraceae bacterium]|nr:inositol monophosphatase [Lachnospiraceae bacterium]